MRSRLIVLGIVASLLALALWLTTGRPAPDPGPPQKTDEPDPTAAAETTTGDERAGRLAPTRGGEAPGAASSSVSGLGPAPSGGVDPANAAPGSEREPSEAQKEQLRGAVRGLMPLVQECYQNALEDHPKLMGKVMIDFEVVGDGETGGLVDNVRIDEEKTRFANASPAALESLRTCVTESQYVMEVGPPGTEPVEASYKTIFLPDGVTSEEFEAAMDEALPGALPRE